MAVNRRTGQLLAASVTALIEATAQHMPSGPYRDFTMWAFSAANPHQQQYLQATGLVKLAQMNATLLDGLIDDDGWPTMLRYASVMNVYQIFEVVSDNLAFGLGGHHLDSAARDRLDLVSAVNRAMTRILTLGRREPAVLLLSGRARDICRRTSGFGQSLAPGKQAAVAQAYAQSQAHAGQNTPRLEELEFGLWSALIVNVESCHDLLHTLADTTTAGLLRHGLADRYRAVERTLRADHLPRLELATLGAQSILVSPTLAYYTAILAERVHTDPAYPKLIDDGTLADLLADAALLVRLQNDIGTRLLRMAPQQQTALLHRLSAGAAGGTGAAEALDLLATTTADDTAFTRLHKDLANGESNVALWHARRALDGESALAALAESLAFFSSIYATHSARLATGLAELDRRLGHRRLSTCIERFVRFHERMYANNHTELIGEYAV